MKLEASDVIETMFSAMITAIVTGATLVVTIGQLVLTQENGPLGDQRERIGDSMAVRDSVSELTGSPTPTDPAAFNDAILGAASERSEAPRHSVYERFDADAGNEDQAARALRDDVDGFVESVVGNADTARGRLDGAYVLRILTLAKRTLAVEPLLLRDSKEQ